MTEFTVHFQKGRRVGARSLRMEHVEAPDASDAIKKAKASFPSWKNEGYRVTRIDHFEDGHIVIDY